MTAIVDKKNVGNLALLEKQSQIGGRAQTNVDRPMPTSGGLDLLRPWHDTYNHIAPFRNRLPVALV